VTAVQDTRAVESPIFRNNNKSSLCGKWTTGDNSDKCDGRRLRSRQLDFNRSTVRAVTDFPLGSIIIIINKRNLVGPSMWIFHVEWNLPSCKNRVCSPLFFILFVVFCVDDFRRNVFYDKVFFILSFACRSSRDSLVVLFERPWQKVFGTSQETNSRATFTVPVLLLWTAVHS